MHWMHSSGFQIGICTAISRFSYFVVPCGKVPSARSTKALTGNWSPSIRSIMLAMLRTKSGSSLNASGASCASFQLSGMLIFWTASIPASIAFSFMEMIASPLCPYDLRAASFMCFIASSAGMTGRILKKAA